MAHLMSTWSLVDLQLQLCAHDAHFRQALQQTSTRQKAALRHESLDGRSRGLRVPFGTEPMTQIFFQQCLKNLVNDRIYLVNVTYTDPLKEHSGWKKKWNGRKKFNDFAFTHKSFVLRSHKKLCIPPSVLCEQMQSFSGECNMLVREH